MIRLKKFVTGSWDVLVDGLLVGALTHVKGCAWYYTDLHSMAREPLDVPSNRLNDAFTAMLRHLSDVTSTPRDAMENHTQDRAIQQQFDEGDIPF